MLLYVNKQQSICRYRPFVNVGSGANDAMKETEEQTDNKHAVRRLYSEVWSEGDLGVIDELFADTFEHFGPAVPGNLSGIEGYKEFVMMFRNAFPDTQIEVVESVEERGTIAVRWLGHGTHRGTLMGIDATNQRVANPRVSLIRSERRSISEIWDIYDTYGLLRKLGATDSLAD